MCNAVYLGMFVCCKHIILKMDAVPLVSRGNINPLTLNDHYSGRTAPLTSKCFILYIYSTNTGTEYFKRGIYSPSSFSGLGVACWPLVPKFAGSNPAEAVGFLGQKNPQHAFLWRGSKGISPMS